MRCKSGNASLKNKNKTCAFYIQYNIVQAKCGMDGLSVSLASVSLDLFPFLP